MKKAIYILFVYLMMVSLSSAATAYNSRGALDWYGYQSLVSTEAYHQDHSDDGDDRVFRKRRHKRRRKIRPPKKGW
tara:strand:+ start:115 stop:342 length:228 start_codon:yes stop_codon:yes gene_type:complete